MELAPSLEKLLSQSIQEAIAKGFESLTSEYFLKVLLENDSLEELLRHSGANTNELKSQLEGFNSSEEKASTTNNSKLLERFLSSLEAGKFLADNIMDYQQKP